MSITFKSFKEKTFLIPLNSQGQWSDYKNFTSQQWKQNIINVLRLVIASNQPTLSKVKLNAMAESQLNMFIDNIKTNLSAETPCLALAFPPAQCWFVAFVVEAFLPLENEKTHTVFTPKNYANHDQTIEIIKAKGDPTVFAFSLVSEINQS